MLPQPRSEDRFGLFPLSLAATYGIDVSFFSSRYLDVSVPWVRSIRPMNSAAGDRELPRPRFRIQKSPDRRSFASFPELIAGYHVFRRLSMPRHPPYTLKSLTTFIDHRLHQGASARWSAFGALHSTSTTGPAGEPGRYKRSITDSFAKKGARRHLPRQAGGYCSVPSH